MRHGLKVYDVDTHVHATAEVLEPYLAAAVRAQVAEGSPYRQPMPRNISGEPLPPPHPHRFQLRGGRSAGSGWLEDPPRILGEAGPRPNAQRKWQNFLGSKLPAQDAEWVPASRIRDMDEEGVDVQVMVPAVARGHEDQAVDVEFIRANHRFLNDFCNTYPGRLKALLTLDGSLIDESVQEIRTWGKSGWAVGVLVNLPLDFPIDHPDLHPIWAAVEEHGLCVAHHSFAVGYPGYRDLWANPFMARTASHPWGAMRAVAAFLGAGLLDRYPGIRFAILESGFGWLPFWAVRMQDQMGYMGYVPELQHTMREYMASGRFFAAIVLHEGGEMVKLVSDYLGDQLLMFSTDYPHPESHFPDSVDLALGWEHLTPSLLQRILWDNAVQCFGAP